MPDETRDQNDVVPEQAAAADDAAAPREPTESEAEMAGESGDEVAAAGAEQGEAEEVLAKPVSEVIEEPVEKNWYIVKVQVNREDTIREALLRRAKIAGLEEYFDDIRVPTEPVAEFDKNGKRRIVKRKLFAGYIMVRMAINEDTWFLVRETPGIGDFTGSAGKPTPMDPRDVERILKVGGDVTSGQQAIKTNIPFRPGDRVRVKEGHFENFEGEVETIDEANGRVTVMINIFGRSTPVELEHWQIGAV